MQDEKIKSIKKDIIRRLKKNQKQLQCSNSWGDYVSRSLAEEFIKQAVDEVCFFYCRHRPRTVEPMDHLRERIKSLKEKQEIEVLMHEYTLSSSFVGWAHGIARYNKFKIRTKETYTGWKVRRVA